MKKIIFILSLLIISIVSFACTPILVVDDIGNGKIHIEADFTSERTAAGLNFYIIKNKPYNGAELTYDAKEVIFEGEFDEEGKATIVKPKTKRYQIVLLGGPAHEKTIDGPSLKKEEIDIWEKEIEKADYLGKWKESMTEK